MMTYERKYETAKEREESSIRELVMKDQVNRLWEYYGRNIPEVNHYGYRRKGKV